MDLYTCVTIPKATFTFSHDHPILLMGSCFAENIGRKLEDNKFKVDINPFGTLYNPISVASGIRRLSDPVRYEAEDLFEYEGWYHCFDYHSRFSSVSKEESLANMNERLAHASEQLGKTRCLIVTWGSAYVYILKESGKVVSNCHKLPDRLFERKRLGVDEIVDSWSRLLSGLFLENKDLRVLFTVSPIRHWKDGAHANQLSKAVLLLAIDKLQSDYPERIGYFPAYEIMMDELRDYRFYADDMLHPSSLAIEYIWKLFAESYLSGETLSLLKEWESIRKALNHKPFNTESEAYKQFVLQTLLKIERINQKIPFFADNELIRIREELGRLNNRP